MNISLSPETLARPILTAMNSYNWERWREYDGAEHVIPDHYDRVIREYLNYLAAVGIHFQMDRDPENGMFSGITINGESFHLDFFGERQRYLDQYHPGEKSINYKLPASPCSLDFSFLPGFSDMFASQNEEESEQK